MARLAVRRTSNASRGRSAAERPPRRRGAVIGLLVAFVAGAAAALAAAGVARRFSEVFE